MTGGELLALYAVWVLLPTIAGALAGAVLIRSNRLKAGLIGAVIGCVAGQTSMLYFARLG